MDMMLVVQRKHGAMSLAENPGQWQTRAMNYKATVFALAALASTGFGPAAQAPKPAASSAKVVVYKSPT